ncbi:putative leucine-rich repeat-containing protein DDB_G0290503 isoform X1 [Sebastes umbrosus]|uniref:putative leucine-rich repeat-containing protein DDB_G0290503 isoform X1 n=1 Tax=Sebastes umbrosus TaxID=72105 RepID=UPI0018A0FCE4|nr:putative leucine-rich repeat-containing protein DDB_G0290503 isoform X1 [Sebastes umbrosus]
MGQTLTLPSSSNLKAEIDELLKSEEAWAAKFNAIKELSENVSGIEQSWESKIHQLEDDNKVLTDKLDLAENDKKMEALLQEKISQLETQLDQKNSKILDLSKQTVCLSEWLTETRKKLLDKRDELGDCEETWEGKYREQKIYFYKVQDEKDDFYMTTIKRISGDKEKLQDKFNEDLAESDQSWINAVKRMDDETTLLEDICLDMKKKMRGFFSFSRTEDRGKWLQELKSKMREKLKKEEEQEAEVEQRAQRDEAEKKEKGFFRWMLRKRKRKSDCANQVEEEAAGCSASAACDSQVEEAAGCSASAACDSQVEEAAACDSQVEEAAGCAA